MPQVMLVKLSALESLPVFMNVTADAVNVTNTEIASTVIDDGAAVKRLQGTLGLLVKGATNVGGICCDNSGNMYIADQTQHFIIKVSESGKVNIVAGKAGTSGNNSAKQHVPAADARFNTPRGICCDKSGNLYVADSANNQIRKIGQDGYVSVLAGNGAASGAGGAGLVDASLDPLQSKFSNPTAVAVDNSGIVYVCDTGNHAIRRIGYSSSGGVVLTLAGGASGDKENVKATKVAGANAIFNTPNGIAVDAKGNIFVMDNGNRKIKKITPNGWVYLFSGSGSAGRSLGTSPEKAYTCTYGGFTYAGVTVDKYGYLYVVDGVRGDERLLKVDPNGVPAVVCDFTQATNYRAKLAGVTVTPAQKVFLTITA